MFSKIRLSLGRINYKLYFALLVLGFTSTIYTTIRVFFLGQLPGDWSFSIAGQLSWVNLLYEILNEAIILPLFFFIGKAKKDSLTFSNCIRTGFLICFSVFSLLSTIVFIFAEPLLNLMAADPSIISESAYYIRIESIANIFGVLMQFALVTLITINNDFYLYAITTAKLVLCLVSDTFLVSSLPISLNLGVNGIGYSNIIVNLILLMVSVILLSREKVCVFTNAKLDFSWAKEFFKIGGISGLESLVRNVAYMVMISRLVNMVGEQGTYWVANNFIWGWILLPIIQLGELIKKEIAEAKDNLRCNSIGYFALTGIICAFWFASVPLWKPFMSHVLGFNDVDKLFNLVLLLLGFYVLYAIQNVFDSTFYGLGKTNYMLFESVVTNTIFYGGAFLLYLAGLWIPTLTGIALLFGLGNVFDSVVSYFAYARLLKKEKISLI